MPDTPLKWYYSEGPDADVVLSSRVRLARNLRGIPFTSRFSGEDAGRIIGLVEGALADALPGAVLRRMDQYSPTARQALTEKHLISPQFAASPDGRALALSADEGLSIMVNEEDHLRIQCICAGFDLQGALTAAVAADRALEERLPYAASAELGYLTHCPTNLGTGMRASVMLHLPAMCISGAIGDLVSSAGKLGLAVRGSYGEGSEAEGNLFQLSNQVTMGLSEEQIVEKLTTVTAQIVAEERAIRMRLLATDRDALEDKIMRSLALLRGAHMLSAAECTALLSGVRMGVSCGLLRGCTAADLNAFGITAGVGGITELSGASDAHARDLARARLARTSLAQVYVADEAAGEP